MIHFKSFMLYLFIGTSTTAVSQLADTTQWEFCECVIQNDSINNVVEEAEGDANWDGILNRMDEIDRHCRKMLAKPHVTTEEQNLHRERVRKCLGIIE